jgi:hypothetical protein
MNNLSNSKREIKHMIVSNGNYKVINEIGCNTMVELFGTCIAYKLNEQNHIIFLCDNNHKCQLKINQIEVFIFENIYDISFKVGIGLNYIDNIQITNTSIFYNFNYIVPHYSKDISINITKGNEINTFIQNKIDVDSIKKKCLRYSLNNEGVCNYILKLVNENNIDISNTGNIDFGQKIKLHCISKMNSIDICEQVYKKVFPVFIKLQKEFESPLRLISNGQSILSEENKTNLKEIIKTCELKNNLKLLKLDNICFNEELLNTIKVYFLSNNKCLKEYCRFCCINIPNKTKYCDKYCIRQN